MSEELRAEVRGLLKDRPEVDRVRVTFMREVDGTTVECLDYYEVPKQEFEATLDDADRWMFLRDLFKGALR